MKRSFLLNMLAILAGLVGIAALGGVSLSVSASLYRLFAAAAAFFISWQLFAAGLDVPAKRQARLHQGGAARGRARAALHRAA